MVVEIKVPTVGESINEVTLVKWLKKTGDYVKRDEIVAELESEKATFEISAEQAGQLTTIGTEGDTLHVGDLVCTINTDITAPAFAEGASTANSVAQVNTSAVGEKNTTSTVTTQAVAVEPPTVNAIHATVPTDVKATPVAAAIITQQKLDTKAISPTGVNGKILKDDVLHALQNPGVAASIVLNNRDERAEKMSNLRKTISRRLVEAKNTTAMLTTFNEVDMSAIMEIRTKNKDKFKETHGVNLGFMSFFTKACTYALQEWPSVNAYINGDEILYHNYCDISIAVSAPKGLVVPVIRNAESMNMAQIEQAVVALATKARDGKLTMDEMQGGTFTITNGGVFGSLMSTPIINIPQSAILGMHKIQDRPMAINGKVEIKPMMYLALSYDHRIIDGRESVGFLVRVKELLENPALLLMGKEPVKTLLGL